MLVDSHCHLDYFGAAAGDVIARARRAGVGLMLTIGARISEFEKVRAIAIAHDDVYCTVGVHPHEAGGEGAEQGAGARGVSVADLSALARRDKVVGLGETGLDYFYDHSPRDAQRAAFRSHIQAAQRGGPPLVVHTRDAEDDTIAILREHYQDAPFTGVIHCFSGSRQLAENALEIGFYISFSGILTFKRAETLRAIARDLPLDRILVETDAPYLAPVPHRGKRNEPAFVTHTAACLAELRGCDAARIAATTGANFFRLFSRAEAAARPGG